MKSLKKVLAGALVSAGLLGASSQASATLSLVFQDQFFNDIAVFTTTTETDVAFKGTILGWNVGVSVGGTTYSPVYQLSMGGAGVFRNTVAGGSFGNCSITGLVTSGFTSYAPTLTSGYSSLCNSASGAVNSVLRIVVRDDSFPQATSGVNLDYSLQSGRTVAPEPGLTAQGKVLASVTSAPPGFFQYLGPNQALWQNTPVNTSFAVGAISSATTTLELGIDLYSPSTYANTPAGRQAGQFLWTMDISTSIPEPGTLALLGLSLLGFAAMRRRKEI